MKFVCPYVQASKDIIHAVLNKTISGCQIIIVSSTKWTEVVHKKNYY